MDNDQRASEDEYRGLTERLRAFGSAPLAEQVGSGALAGVRARQARGSDGRAKWIVAAAVAGFVAGSVGLAAADVLPAPVQDVAHHALDAVGVHVPPGHQRFNDPVACPGGPYANHGAYVRAHHDDPNAGASPCGKPLQAVKPGAGADDTGEPADSHGNGKHTQEGNPGKGNGKGNRTGSGHGNGQGTGQGNGLKHHGKPDDNSDTSPDEPATNVTPTSVRAPITTSPPTTSAPTTTTTELVTPTT
jgi:hypothetical protein